MRKLLWATFGVALISMVFAGCKKEEEPTYMVQATATEGGTVEGQNGEYKEGETVVFTAVPAEGYYFSRWRDGSTDNPRSLVVSDVAVNLYAEFRKNPLVTITADSHGTIGGFESGRYAPGDSLSFTAIASDGYYFSQWDDGSTTNPRIINVGRTDITIAAKFIAVTTVDLGLPSGNLWATCNLGAEQPWKYGHYYAWGETQPKSTYDFENYNYYNSTDSSITKYNYDAAKGPVDNKNILEPTDDVAAVLIGANFSVPSNDDWIELGNECYWRWTYNYNDDYTFVSGYIIYKAKADSDRGVKKTKNDISLVSYTLSDAHIFLPAAGFAHNRHVNQDGSYCKYWSSSLSENYCYNAHSCSCFDYYCSPSGVGSREEGCPIRPVRHK